MSEYNFNEEEDGQFSVDYGLDPLTVDIVYTGTTGGFTDEDGTVYVKNEVVSVDEETADRLLSISRGGYKPFSEAV